MDRSLDFETLAAQAGLRAPMGEGLSTVAPIHASTTFTYDTIDRVHEALVPGGSGFAYARNANPTVAALESAMARLEGTDTVVAFGSGMAAMHAALLGSGLEEGDTVVAGSELYGVTRSLLTQLAAFGIRTAYVDMRDLDAVDRALSAPDTRALLFESITNPLVHVADIAALAELARRRRVVSVLDNTFATPVLLRPAALGVDITVHSATKYIAGHGDAVAGLVATSSSFAERIRSVRTTTGGILSPFEAWLTVRGVRTMPLRVERQCATALSVAEWLQAQSWTERVYYPGLPGNPQRELAERQFGGRFGGVVAFDLAAGRDGTLRFIDHLQLITPGTSLGDVESLVLYPPLSSHRGLNDQELTAAGIGEGLIRLSVGLESARDLEADLAQAAQRAGLAQAVTARA